MDLDTWISGDGSVDSELVQHKAVLIARAVAVCATAVLQTTFAKQEKKQTGYKELADEVLSGQKVTPSLLDEILPKEHHFTSDSPSMAYLREILSSRDNDTYALFALQEMAGLNFECVFNDPTPDGYWRHFEVVLSCLNVLLRLFSEIIPKKNYQDVNVQRLQLLDLSMNKLFFEAGQVAAVSVDETIRHDGIRNMKMGETAIALERRKLTIGFYEELGDRAKNMKITPISNLIRNKYIKKFGKRKARSAKQIRADLKAAGIF